MERKIMKAAEICITLRLPILVIAKSPTFSLNINVDHLTRIYKKLINAQDIKS